MDSFFPKRIYTVVKDGARKHTQKKRVKECDRGGESDTFTPSWQFACGPLSLPYLVLLLLHRPPSSLSCLVFRLWNLSQSKLCHKGWKTERAKKRGWENRGWERPGGGNVERGWRDFIRREMDNFAKILSDPSKSQWCQWVFRTKVA